LLAGGRATIREKADNPEAKGKEKEKPINDTIENHTYRYWTTPSSSPHANFFDGEDDTRSAPDKRSGKERDQTKPRSTLRGPA
jgi:hypothetical protein